MHTYKAAYSNQDQLINYSAEQLQETYSGSRTYKFLAIARLVLAAGVDGVTVNYTSPTVATGTATTATYFGVVANTKRIVANVTGLGYYHSTYNDATSGEDVNYNTWERKYSARILVRLWYYDGLWRSVYKYITTTTDSYNQISIDTGTRSSDITKISVTCEWNTNYNNIMTLTPVPDAIASGNTYGCQLLSYTSNLGTTTTIANGTLNWTATGS